MAGASAAGAATGLRVALRCSDQSPPYGLLENKRAVPVPRRRGICAVVFRAPLLAKPGRFTHNSRIDCVAAAGGLMTMFRISHFRPGWMLGTALLLAMWSTASQAYTPEQQQACSGDAFRLCSADIPDVDRVTTCMIRNKAQLSPECRAHFRPEPEPAAAAGQPTNIRPAGVRPAKPVKPASTTKPKPKKPKPATT